MSAGGVVFRRRDGRVEVALVGRREPERWALPKGAPHQGESLEQAAAREVSEETGLEVRVIRPLAEIGYWFVLRGVRHFKRVHFYLMEAVGGDVSLHDAEYDVVAWFPIEEARRRISYANEARVVEQAAQLLARGEA